MNTRATLSEILITGINQVLEETIAEQHVTGLVLAVVQKGQIVHTFQFGYASIELGVSISGKNLFQLFSTTKMFTGTAVLHLLLHNRIDIDNVIGEFLPALPDTWGSVTIEHLLTHTSGLPDLISDYQSGTLLALDCEEALKKVKELAMLFSPGERWCYNQTNYVLLGILIERVSGISFQEYMQKNLFEPLGLHNAKFGDSSTVIHGRPTYYQSGPNHELLVNHFNFPNFMWPCAGLNCSAIDLAAWAKAIHSGNILPQPLMENLWKPVQLKNGEIFYHENSRHGYGLGWTVNDYGRHKIVGHSGGNSTIFAHFVNQDTTVIILANHPFNPEETMIRLSFLIFPEMRFA